MQQDIDRAKATFSEAKAAFPLVARELKKKRHPKPAEFKEGIYHCEVGKIRHLITGESLVILAIWKPDL
jgi:hypothetical protein